jgi:hypothetical protein
MPLKKMTKNLDSNALSLLYSYKLAISLAKRRISKIILLKL